MRRLGVVGNPEYPGLASVLDQLREAAPALGLEVRFESDLAARYGGDKFDSPDEFDALVTLGGDGTLLRGARLLGGREIPILGINLGRLGFLTTCGLDEFQRALTRLATGDFTRMVRMMIEGHPSSAADTRRWYALNDIVLHKGGKARVMWLRVAVDGEEIASYAADGIVLATPTGSTAYNLSAGGPVVVPTHHSIIVTPISAHTLAIRPLVLGPDAEVVVHAEGEESERLVTVDGQVGTTLGRSESLVVRKAPRSVVLVRFPEMTFFGRMRRKLGWAAPGDEVGG
ncbi:MAG TPA: NAD(+)/NADH kinase [Gemmatimonadaceae bacterium]